MSDTEDFIQGTCEQVAENTFIKFGYKGWVQLLAILANRISEHEKASSRPRPEPQRQTPRLHYIKRSEPKLPPKPQPKAAKLPGENSTAIYRRKVVAEFAPHLLEKIESGEMALKTAWNEAMKGKKRQKLKAHLAESIEIKKSKT